MSISTVIISSNEESSIEKCIESVLEFSDEVIVVDDFSIDRTAEIALSIEKVNFHQRKFDNYINQKNYANSQATSDYIFSIDSDEWCSDEMIKYLVENKSNLPAAMSFVRINMVGDKMIKYGLWAYEQKIRLWKNKIAEWGGTTPHESVIFQSSEQEVENTEYVIYHRSVENLSELYDKSMKYAKMASFELSQKSLASLVFKMIFSPITKLIKSLILKKGFMDGYNGIAISLISTIETFHKYLSAINRKLGL